MSKYRFVCNLASFSGFLGLLALGCSAPTQPAEGSVTASAPPVKEATVSKPAAREGALITYRGSTKLGRVAYRDDGTKLTSDVAFAGKSFQVALSRSPRHARVDLGGKVSEVEVPADTLVLENGDWAAYALAAEWFGSATEPKAVHVLLPSQGVTLDGQLTVRPRAGGGRDVDLELKGLRASAVIDADGTVRSASVPAQGIEVRREGDPAPVEAVRAAPASVEESPFDVDSSGVALSGTLWIPKGQGDNPPVALIVAGSGPTDRDGNSALGLKSDAYRMLAEALAARGVATVRYDKRGVGKSSVAFDPAKLVLDDFVNDAAAYLQKLKASGRFSRVGVIGHSEGGLIALQLAQRKDVDAFALVATAGRPVAVLLHEQLSKSLDAKLLAAADRGIAALRVGTSPDPVPPELASLFHPSVRAFLKSELDVDPLQLFKRTKARAVIVQGEHDVQVAVVDAKLLAGARPDAKLTLLPSMSHVLKDEPSKVQPQASYTDPSRPLAPGLAEAVAAAFGK